MYKYILVSNKDNNSFGSWDTAVEAKEFLDRIIAKKTFKEKLYVKQVPAIRCPTCGEYVPEMSFATIECISCDHVRADAMSNIESDSL